MVRNNKNRSAAKQSDNDLLRQTIISTYDISRKFAKYIDNHLQDRAQPPFDFMLLLQQSQEVIMSCVQLIYIDSIANPDKIHKLVEIVQLSESIHIISGQGGEKFLTYLTSFYGSFYVGELLWEKIDWNKVLVTCELLTELYKLHFVSDDIMAYWLDKILDEAEDSETAQGIFLVSFYRIKDTMNFRDPNLCKGFMDVVRAFKNKGPQSSKQRQQPPPSAEFKEIAKKTVAGEMTITDVSSIIDHIDHDNFAEFFVQSMLDNPKCAKRFMKVVKDVPKVLTLCGNYMIHVRKVRTLTLKFRILFECRRQLVKNFKDSKLSGLQANVLCQFMAELYMNNMMRSHQVVSIFSQLVSHDSLWSKICAKVLLTIVKDKLSEELGGSINFDPYMKMFDQIKCDRKGKISLAGNA